MPTRESPNSAPTAPRADLLPSLDAFDADVLIYAAGGDLRGHPIRRLLDQDPAGVGSVLLVPELLSHPLRHGRMEEVRSLQVMLSHLDLKPVDVSTADHAAVLGSKYRLRAADAVHLATAVISNADRFITNNSKDFPVSITEIEVTYPNMIN